MSPLPVDHRRQYWTPKDPVAQLAVELGLRFRRLHERDPGARAQVLRQEGVQSGRWRCRYQLDGNQLACTNSAEAARQGSSPRFHVSQVDCVSPNGRGNRRFLEPSQKVSQIFERNVPHEITHKNKISLYCCLRTQWGRCDNVHRPHAWHGIERS